jgi:CubicO group peptidase (beta-lactamase class C family)
MKTAAACLWLLCLLTPIPALASGQDLPDEIDRLLQETGLPGIVWSAIGDSGPVSGANGLADIANARPMTVDSKVHVGSVTKTVLALGVLRLVSEGKLSLDTDVEQLLPRLNWKNPWRDEAPIRVRHLLEHTAGLDNVRMWQFLNSRVTTETPLLAAFPRDHGDLLQIRSRPGSQYSYSNMGYALLGMVIEQVTRQRYEDYLAESLLAPLGMRDSSFHLITQAGDTRLAMGYLDDNVEQPAIPMVLRPAGQFTTTAPDMLRLMAFALGDGSLDRAPFIAPELMAQLGRPSTTEAFRNGLEIGHGLALAGRDRHGVLAYCHPGTTFGFRAYLCLFPAEGKAFFYAINADDETADYEAFNKLLIQQLAVTGVAAAVATAEAESLREHTGFYALSPNNMAQFAWLDWMFNSLWVSEHPPTRSLVILSPQQPPRRLEPLGNGLFRDAERRLASHVFFDDALLSNGLATWRKASLPSFILAWASLAAGLMGLAYIVIRGSWLLIRRNHTPDSTLLWPYLGIVAFALPAFLYTRQHFLEFGEQTAASVLVAILTGALPLLLGFALVRLKQHKRMFAPDLLAMLALLQLCLVLLYQGVLPVMFWL